MRQLRVVAARYSFESHFGSIARRHAIQDAIHVVHSAGLHEGFHIRKRPGIRCAGVCVREFHPIALEVFQAKRRIALVDRNQGRCVRIAPLSFHPLRQSFLNPGRSVTQRFLPHKTMRQFVLQYEREFRRTLV